MSKPRYYWFGFVQKCVCRYPKMLTAEGSVQARIALKAIDEALAEIEKNGPDGKDKVKLVEMMYIKKTHTMDGAAMKLHVSPATAKRWNSEFIHNVGARMGFLPK